MPWLCALVDGHREVIIDKLAKDFAGKFAKTPPAGVTDDNKDDRNTAKNDRMAMADGFFYRMRERFELLNPPATDNDKLVTANKLRLTINRYSIQMMMP